jgi:hypothetical protein
MLGQQITLLSSISFHESSRFIVTYTCYFVGVGNIVSHSKGRNMLRGFDTRFIKNVDLKRRH